MAESKTIKVLMIEDNPDDALIMRKLLGKATRSSFELEHADRLLPGLKRLREGEFDILLLDLSLPDSHGLATLIEAHSQAPGLPIVVLTGFEDESAGLKAVQEGAQDYLLKGKVSTYLLERSINYSIERHRMAEELRNLSLTDELTGLHNRRGFITLSQQQIRQAKRTKKEMLLLFVDLDGLKKINDGFGHSEGDRALFAVAALLRETFRDSDIVARIGGDEFAVLAMETENGGGIWFLPASRRTWTASTHKGGPTTTSA